MSRLLIQKYYKELEELIRFGGSKNELSIRHAFQNLLNEYCKKKNFRLVPEINFGTPFNTFVTPDGTIKDPLELNWGYWESKDQYDDINKEIEDKIKKGYPTDNILFEDSNTAVLYQGGREVARINMKKEDELDRVLNALVNYERQEVKNFRDAIDKFKEDVPDVAERLRKLIEDQKVNVEYIKARDKFLEVCKETINPDISTEDIREMIVQHILTEDIFITIFEETQFHHENNIAKELEILVSTFFKTDIKRTFLAGIHHYYQQIKAAAAGISDHHEKQKFLKIIYETFYKAYSPKKADRFGVVYTPNEIVRFMIESSDYLCHKHFGKLLADKDVEILDPATGTGTYITELIEYLPTNKLEYKYENEIHANEVAILPYYVANLNIEYTYKQKTGNYKEFKNICFVDTLDNMDFKRMNQQLDAFSSFSMENKERINRQNKRKISVIIGNPPYNANQMNENDNNKNREYPVIDKRIKDTYIKNSTAQKTKVYDMYARFYRWAMDRIGDEGIVAFVSNRSFINSRTFDGFRKIVGDEFNECYIIDTKSDVRANPKIAGTTHNVFGIQTGVAITFLIKKKTKAKCKIFYYTLQDEQRKEEKLEWLGENKIQNINFEHIQPDKNNNWIDIPDNDWEEMIPLANKKTKLAKNQKVENAVFKLFSNGIVSARDEWVYDFDKIVLSDKIKKFIQIYYQEKQRWLKSNKDININDFVNRQIKWTGELESHLKKDTNLNYEKEHIVRALYRPFIIKANYYDRVIIHRIYQQNNIFPIKFNIKGNILISFNGANSVYWDCFANKYLIDYNCFYGGSQSLPLYFFDENGTRKDNITEWGLKKFRDKYGKKVERDDIFNYVYGVLHNPGYRSKYEMNLKREFPRIPFYDNYKKWSDWGKKLMDLHINFETAAKYPLKRNDAPWESDKTPKAKLRADKTAGTITLDEQTTLSKIPASAWEYKLGNRSALEWILDQYKEKTPKDPTIREKFNTYKFADYKEQVIDLIMRVTTVSVETMKIIKEMEKENELSA